jgi:hypothetical protein
LQRWVVGRLIFTISSHFPILIIMVRTASIMSHYLPPLFQNRWFFESDCTRPMVLLKQPLANILPRIPGPCAGPVQRFSPINKRAGNNLNSTLLLLLLWWCSKKFTLIFLLGLLSTLLPSFLHPTSCSHLSDHQGTWFFPHLNLVSPLLNNPLPLCWYCIPIFVSDDTSRLCIIVGVSAVHVQQNWNFFVNMIGVIDTGDPSVRTLPTSFIDSSDSGVLKLWSPGHVWLHFVVGHTSSWTYD